MRPGGLLLTGGASRRLGRDKATLVVHGEALAARAARVLRVVCEPVIEVGPGVTDLPALREDPPGGGPLAALVAGAAALGAARERGVLLVACDLPALEPPLLELLAEWPGAPTVVPRASGEPQLVCARYGPGALDEAARLLALGHRSLRALLAATDHDLVPADVWGAVASTDVFADIDTPDDLARLRPDDR